LNIRLPNSVVAAISVLLLAVLLMAFAYGVVVQRFGVYPYQLIAEVEEAINWSLDKRPGEMPWYYRPTTQTSRVTSSDQFSDDRLNLMTSMGADDQVTISVFDAQAKVLNKVIVDWFEIWPDAQHLPASAVPRAQPGTHIHGIAMLPDGDVVFNFEQLGLVRISACGEVVWKLPYRTHHSVTVDENGDLWVPGQITHAEKLKDYPNHIPPFREPVVLKVSPDGEILQEIPVFEVLIKNDLRAYMHLVTPNNLNTIVTGDTLHFNDVEVFSSALEEGVFRHGDIMISLRNVSTVLVFDPETFEIRYLQTGGFTRQHDPDFIDGNTISVFDNNHIAPQNFGQQSRILVLSADSGESTVWYEGTAAEPFYTAIMGKSQWLEDNNLLVTDSQSGRAFQLNAEREIVWEFINLVDDGVVGLVEEVQRLPAEMTPLFTAPQSARCVMSDSSSVPSR
jgi:hypothetical protein